MTILKLLSSNGFISYNKTIAKICGVHETIVLGELCSIFSYFHFNEFYINQERISNDTALSVKQIRTALVNLEKNKIITITKKGTPCKNWYFINESVIKELLESCEDNFFSNDDAQMGEQDVPKVPNKESNNSVTSCDEMGALLDNNTNNNINNKISSDKPKSEPPKFNLTSSTKKISSHIKKSTSSFSKSDYDECMDIYYQNRNQLGKQHPVENTIYKIQSYQGIIKPYFEDYGVEVVKQAIKNSFYNTWAASTTYGLTVIFNRKKFDEYASGSKGTVHTQQYKNNKQRGSFASEVYGKEQNWEID